ncbi:hypothetical protein NL676_001671 [Syzygium grande]|nr:hypothetical protein NL676_001671 [Syzygium grande]
MTDDGFRYFSRQLAASRSILEEGILQIGRVSSLEKAHGCKAKRYIRTYDKVLKWNDSTVEEAFPNAKERFWAEINGLPCNISLPDPNIHIDEVDWESEMDPVVFLDLERGLEAFYGSNCSGTVIFGDVLANPSL